MLRKAPHDRREALTALDPGLPEFSVFTSLPCGLDFVSSA
jgi:hypothetical protein